jgi:hypothetical protein
MSTKPKVTEDDLRDFLSTIPRGQNKQTSKQNGDTPKDTWCVATSAGVAIQAQDLVLCYVAKTRSVRLHRLIKAVENQTAKDGAVWTLWLSDEVPLTK